MTLDIGQEVSTVRAEIARADSKASTLLGLAGTATSITAAAATVTGQALPLFAHISLWLGIAHLAAAVAVLLRVIRPALPRHRGGGAGWTTYAGRTPAELADTASVDHERGQIAELVCLSDLAWTKYRRIQWAVDLQLLALAAFTPVPILLILTGGTS